MKEGGGGGREVGKEIVKKGVEGEGRKVVVKEKKNEEA